MSEKIDELYRKYLNEKLDAIFKGANGTIHINGLIINESKNNNLEKKGDYNNGNLQRVKKTEGDKCWWNYADANGIRISFTWYDDVGDFHDGYARVKRNKKWNFINPKGEIISPNLWFDYVFTFKNGYARVNKNGKWNFINPKGEIISPNLWFDDVIYFENGYGQVKKNGKWNFINPKGEIISPNLWFDYVFTFKNGYARVNKNCKWNFINSKGEILSPNLWFDDVFYFENGYAKVIKYDKKHEYTYYINSKGELFDAIISRNFAYVGKHIKCLTIDMQDYQVKKTTLGYQCVNYNDKYNLKYEPIKRFGVRYTLCLKKNIVCLYDRISNNYKDIGTINDIEFDDNFIFDKRNEKVYLIYEDKMIDVTEYYNSYLSDKKGIHITSGICNILTRDEFAFLNAREIENAMKEEKIRKKKEQEEIERLQKLQEIQEQKKRLKDEKEDHIRKQKALKDKAEQEKIDALKKIQEGLDTLRNNGVKELPTIREKIENIFVINDNYKEIDSDYLGVLMLIDLSQTDFSNVNVRNIDFRNTNIVISSFHLNPQTVYNKDLRNCNFEGIHIDPMANFSNVDIRGAKFSNDDNIATLDMFNYTFKDAIYDENTTYNGESIEEKLGKCAKI